MGSPRRPDRCGGHGHARIRRRHGGCRARRRNARRRHDARHAEGGTASTGEAETTGSSASEEPTSSTAVPAPIGCGAAPCRSARRKRQDAGPGRLWAGSRRRDVDLLDLVHRSCETVRRPQASTNSQPPEPPAVVKENARPGTPGWPLRPGTGASHRGLHGAEHGAGRDADVSRLDRARGRLPDPRLPSRVLLRKSEAPRRVPAFLRRRRRGSTSDQDRSRARKAWSMPAGPSASSSRSRTTGCPATTSHTSS